MIAGLPVHPLLEVLAMDEQAVQRIAESIQERGQDVPIATWRGMIVDGRHRARACAALGIEPKVQALPDSWDDAHVEGFILDANFNRKDAPWRDRVAAYLRLRHGWPGEVDPGVKPSREDVARRVRLRNETAIQLDRLVAAATEGTRWGARKTAHGGETVGQRSNGKELPEEIRLSAMGYLRGQPMAPDDIAAWHESIVGRIAAHFERDMRRKAEEKRSAEIAAAGAIDFNAKKREKLRQAATRWAEKIMPTAGKTPLELESGAADHTAALVETSRAMFEAVLRKCDALPLKDREELCTYFWRRLSEYRNQSRARAT